MDEDLPIADSASPRGLPDGFNPERAAADGQLDYTLLFRWFVGLSLNMDDSVWDATVFTKNRERLLGGRHRPGILRAGHAQPVVDWSHQVDNPAVAGETRAALERGLSRLSDEYRSVILLHDVEGLPNEDVAATLGLTVAAVKSRVHRARLVLRQQLAHHFSSAR